jgi:two-component system, chemotaxis family, CheB/CheR fusion protein
VDHVLPVEQMPETVIKYVRHDYVKAPSSSAPPPEDARDLVTAILALLKARANLDFGCYRKPTLRRRIHRRMSLQHIASTAEYLRLLRSDEDEVKALRKDLLINVTSFFRDPQAWQILADQVIPAIVARRKEHDVLRVWVPACSSGEEAYSIAILLLEQLQRDRKRRHLQVFASDVDADALEVARAGLYPESISAGVTPERLRHFFSKEEHSYRVSKDLRECVVVAEQNLLTDPPFSKLDLISCRNLLVYLEPSVQDRLIGLLHFGLLEGGYLFLGSAESIGAHDDLFEPVSKKWRIYRRIGPTRHDKVEFPVIPASQASAPSLASPPVPSGVGRIVAMQQVLLERYTPACVIVTRKGEMVHFSGSTHEYLLQPAGLATQDVFAQARDGLQTALRAAVQKAIREERPITASASVRRGGGSRRVKIVAEALKGSRDTEGLILIAFQDEPRPEEVPSAPAVVESGGAEEPLVRQLESELQTTRAELRSTVEQFETANEELKASNEEVMSANEELQSTNEELQTSKEELQSLNEELNTINAQLESKLRELERTNNDLDNLLTSTNVATIFLDPRLRIRRFTPAATRLFNLLPSDVDRPLSDIVPRFTDAGLLRDAATVLDDLSPMSGEVRTLDGQWYMREVLPYRTRDNRIEGVVITFSDVAGGVVRAARFRTDTIVDMVGEALLVLDDTLRVQSANRSFYEMFQTSTGETENRLLYDLGEHEWDVPPLRRALAGVVERNESFHDLELTITFARLGRRTIELSARPLAEGGKTTPGLLLLEIANVTERKRREEALLESESKLRAIVEAAAVGIVTIDEAGTVIAFNQAAERLFGHPASEMIGQNVSLLMPSLYGNEPAGHPTHHLRTGVARIVGKTQEAVGRRKDGTTFPMELSIGEWRDGVPRGFVGIVQDISERKRAEEEAARHQLELGRALRLGAMGELAAGLAHELNQPLSVVANTLGTCVTRLRSGPVRASMLIRLLERATSEVVRTGEIVRDLRELVQNRQPRRERLDLRRAVETVARLLAGELKGHWITLHLDLGSRELPVDVVRVQLEQVLLNLLQNAIDAIRAGRGKRRDITVRATRSSGGVGVSVHDSGKGISDVVARRMFEPLYTTKKDGLGMGLVVSRSIIEAHGGRLGVAAGVRGQNGATLRFTLPLAAAAGRARRARRKAKAR